ncbi:deoxyuridine 5'-triphosphate nucleotidohydrolase [Ichthyobacterium seriolicida]|uniref:Deoxyuridine 5'-triphosphate nucleotidohydrolase n=1 Tax=Ichthyobacterium seriolicida TaxID=242600 RepID=A0A1J1ECX7_9FLAO|nr:deoxyuridine 5'-triphosphate nucleotidohydrolase [Ichthyobacterium seriolicida]
MLKLLLAVILFYACGSNKKESSKKIKSDKSTIALSRSAENTEEIDDLNKSMITFDELLFNTGKVITPKTLESSVSVSIKSKDTDMSLSLDMRLEKDSIIWLNYSLLGFPVFRAKITPDKISVMDRINQVHYETDFSYVEKILGIELKFNQLQSIVFGEPIFPFEREKTSLSADSNAYKVIDKSSLNKTVWFNSKTLKVIKQHVQDKNNRAIYLKNDEFSDYNSIVLPTSVSLTLKEDLINNTLVKLNFSTSGINKKFSFPYEVPKTYKRIVQ